MKKPLLPQAYADVTSADPGARFSITPLIGSVGGNVGAGFDIGIGVPFQLDLVLSGKYVGLCVSATVLGDRDGGSGGLMLGLPFGLLRR